MGKTFLGALCGSLVIISAGGVANAATFYSADLTPLNGSGVSGTARLMLNEARSQLTIRINAIGLVPNQNHPGHIHGRFGTGGDPIDSFTPTPATDTDQDGFIEVGEGAATYGPIILDLSELTDPGPEAPDGTLNYQQTFNLLDNSIYADNDMDGTPDFTRADLLGPNLDRLDLREIVLHGLFVQPGPGAGTPGEVNGTNGYLAFLPVASGEIVVSANMAAIPEPATWAMMIAGFGLVGGTVRSSRRVRIGVSRSA